MPYIKSGLGCSGDGPGLKAKCGCGCKAKITGMGECVGVGEYVGVGNLAETLGSATAKKVGGAAATYHGYKRTGSIIWALVYGAFGYFAPVTTNVVALAQGFGERKPCP